MDLRRFNCHTTPFTLMPSLRDNAAAVMPLFPLMSARIFSPVSASSSPISTLSSEIFTLVSADYSLSDSFSGKTSKIKSDFFYGF